MKILFTEVLNVFLNPVLRFMFNNLYSDSAVVTSTENKLATTSNSSNKVITIATEETEDKYSLTVWIAVGVVITTLIVLMGIATIALALFLKKSSKWKSECDNSYSTLSRGLTEQLQQQSLDPASDLYDRIELSPSTGQAEFISKTETDNINNLSPHPGQHNINPSIDMQQSKSATITAASSNDIPSHDIESTFEQPNYASINKRKKKTMGKEPVHYGPENDVATNLGLVKHKITEENESVHLPHTADKNMNIRQGNAPCNQQTAEPSKEYYTAIRKKTKESTAQNEEKQPPIPPQRVEELYTAVNKKTQPTTANDEVESPPIPPHTVEELYTAVMKKPKARETDDEVEAPPVPPHTVEELYTAVQKNKN